MQVGDLVMLRQSMFDDRLLGILTKKGGIPYNWLILWSNGAKSYHPERYLEVICSK
jgi:hypothetical protein